jgi:hypothetical protein
MLKVEVGVCRTRHRGGPKNYLDYGKRIDFWYLILLEKNGVI